MGSSIFRYYDILPTNNTALNATLRFQYLDAEMNGLNENTIVLWKSPDNTHWSSQGFTTRNTTSNYVEKTGIMDFSRWTLSSVNNALPVLFSSFNARCTGNAVQLNWKTAQEQNSDRFEVERSSDGIHWTSIAMIAAAGNSTVERSYSSIDASPLVAGALYRIAEYDIDGKVHYSGIIRVDCGVMDQWKLWPNPVTELLWVNITTPVTSPVSIKMFDSKGSLVRSQSNTLLPGTNQLSIDMKKYPAGMLLVAVIVVAPGAQLGRISALFPPLKP